MASSESWRGIVASSLDWEQAHATVDGAPVSVVPTDYALCGVVVPAGQHQLILQFRPATFLAGAAVSILGTLGLVFLLFALTVGNRRFLR